MRPTLPIDDGLGVPEYARLARAAEGAGHDPVLAAEVAGPEVFSLLGVLAASARRPRGPSPMAVEGYLAALRAGCS